MWVIIEHPVGEEVSRRELRGEEIIEERIYADAYANTIDSEVDVCEDGCACHVPSCSGDIRVEFRDDPDNAIRIWSGESFYIRGV